MKSKSFYSQVRKAQAISRITALLLITWLLVGTRFAAAASDAPPWMHALVNAPLPAHDEKTDAVRMYVEENVTVISATKIKNVQWFLRGALEKQRNDVLVPSVL